MKTIPLRRYATIVNGGTPTPAEENWNGHVEWATPVDLARSNGGRLGSTDRKLTPLGLATGSTSVPAGAILVSTRAPIGYTARTTQPAAFNQGCKALVPSSAIDARFLQLVLISQTEQMKAAGSGSTFLELSNEALGQVPVPVMTVEEQRRIGDFLDDRVARIDQIIAARQQQVAHLGQAADAQWAGLTTSLDAPWVPLRRFLRSIVDGPFGSSLKSEHYTDFGTRVIRLGNIGIAQFREADAAYIDDDYAAGLQQHAAAPGDLIMAGLGDERWPLGRCAVVPDDLGPAIVKADCYRIRLDDRVQHDFAASILSAPPSRGELTLLSRGATRARLNTEVAREARLPAISLDEQRAYTREVRQLQEGERTSRHVLQAQVERWQEYKQSLITAAVTGEFDVTTAAPILE